jgi:hypothetical protein
MNNARQLYLAGQQMALDGAANSDPNLVFPGDDPNNIKTVSDYMLRLVNNDYLKPGDVQKLLNGPGTNATVNYAAGPPVTLTMGGTTPALKIFKVTDANSSNVVFIESNNYTYDTALPTNTNPFGDKGFIVQRKGGDASILRKNNATVALSGQNDSIFQSTVGKQLSDPDGTVNPEVAGNLLTYP